jgi:hypothetical protein
MPWRSSSSRYSNMTCALTNKQAQENSMNSIPSRDNVGKISHRSVRASFCVNLPLHVPVSCPNMYRTPSVPITKPTRLAMSMSKIFKTAPRAQTCRYQVMLPYYSVKSVNENYRINIALATYFCCWHKLSSNDLRQNKQTDKPSPCE